MCIESVRIFRDFIRRKRLPKRDPAVIIRKDKSTTIGTLIFCPAPSPFNRRRTYAQESQPKAKAFIYYEALL